MRRSGAIVAFCFAALWVLDALLNLATDPKREPLARFLIRNLAVPVSALVLSVIVGVWLWIGPRKPTP